MQLLYLLFGAPTVIVALIAFLSATVLQKEFKVYDPQAVPNSDLIILVTGASSGIGLDTTTALAKLGYKVYGTVRNEKDAEKLRAINLGKTKGQLVPIQMDVTNYESVSKVFNQIKRDVEAGAVFVALVNNAGYVFDAVAEGINENEARKMFDINVFGVMHITKTFLPLLRETKGRVITVGSLAGVCSMALTGAYSASKFAIEGYTDALRRELLNHGVSVSLVQPGIIQTGMTTSEKFDEIKQTMSRDLQKVYAKELAGFISGRSEAQKNKVLAKDTSTPAIIDAIMNKHPRTRYIVAGFGFVPGWFLSAFCKYFPDRVQDFVFGLF